MASFTPPPFLGGDLARYVQDCMQAIARAFLDTVERVRFRSLARSPDKPRDGDIAFFDGTNQGNNGAGLYEYVSGWRRVSGLTGVATLVGGTKAVSLSTITANSRIYVTSQVDGGTPGWLRVSARSVGVSFTVTSSSGTDTSTFAYLVVEP